jgi:hypothetical protein
MNVGQLYECLLDLREMLNSRFKILPFDENGLEISRILINNKKITTSQ